MPDERSPLLQFPGQFSNSSNENVGDLYAQFCQLIGMKPVNYPPGQKYYAQPESLYQRANKHRRNQTATYMFSATVTNGLLLSQVVLGAALTGLGASQSSHILITVFGALNTVIAGVIAFVKSRGQPMRARMFRDDLSRVVDEIENSAVMWQGISNGVHGYDAIDTDDQVTVRSEVARLTRLYDKAVKTNTMNDPDSYAAGNTIDAYSAATRSRGAAAIAPPPALAPPPAPTPAVDDSAGKVATVQPPAPTPAPALDPDESPATQAPTAKVPEPVKPETTPEAKPVPSKDDESSQPSKPSDSSPAIPDAAPSDDNAPAAPPAPAPAPEPAPVTAPTPTNPAPAVVRDPDESPATSAFHISKKANSGQDERKDSAEPSRSSTNDQGSGMENAKASKS